MHAIASQVRSGASRRHRHHCRNLLRRSGM